MKGPATLAQSAQTGKRKLSFLLEESELVLGAIIRAFPLHRKDLVAGSYENEQKNTQILEFSNYVLLLFLIHYHTGVSEYQEGRPIPSSELVSFSSGVSFGFSCTCIQFNFITTSGLRGKTTFKTGFQTGFACWLSKAWLLFMSWFVSCFCSVPESSRFNDKWSEYLCNLCIRTGLRLIYTEICMKMESSSVTVCDCDLLLAFMTKIRKLF